MTFLEPVPALIAGAIAVPALIALYLLKLRRKPLKVSSTLLWEQAFSDLQANVPLRWLRVSWPLVIQLLVLLCLLVAFARPTIPGEGGAALRVVIVIDRSASMSATDGEPAPADGQPPRTRLDEAKDGALRLIGELRRGGGGQRPSAMVVELGASPRVLSGFTDDTRALRDAVRAVQPSDQPAELGPLLPLLRSAVVHDAEGDAGTTSVVLFSDGGLEAVAGTGLPRSVRVELARAGPGPEAKPDNLGIVAFSARRDASTPSTVRVFVRTSNSAATPRDVSLLASVDGAGVGTIPLRIPAATDRPGEAGGTLEFSLATEGLLTVTIPRPDVLSSDNTVGVMLPALEKPRVLVVGPGLTDDASRRVRGEQGVDRFLLGVLREMELAQLRVVGADAYEAGAGEPGARLPYDLVIFDRVAPRSLPPVPSLHIGAGLPLPGLSIEALSDADARTAATRFVSWRRTHPALRYAALDAVLIAPPMRMSIDDRPPAADAPPRPSVTPLAFGAGGPLIAEVAEPGVGSPRRLVLAMDLLQTNWGPDVSFPVFIASAVEYLTGRGDAAAGRSGTTHEPVTIRAEPGAASIGISGPAEATLSVAAATRTAAMGVPERVGVYTFTGAVPADRTLPVNLLSAAESSLQGAADVPALVGESAVAGGAISRADPGQGRREVWHWFVLAAIALLTLEWFVYAWKMRL